MELMLKVAICLAGIFIILQIGEWFYRRKILQGEYLRKFVHISSACFIASWPWLISWNWIGIIGLAMLAVVILNHKRKKLHMDGSIDRKTWGGMIFAISVVFCAALTDEKIIFAIAMLQMGLADGFAAVAGEYYRRGRYKVFGQWKSVYGSVVFLVVSLCVSGVGLLFAFDLIDFSQYVWLIVSLPPILTILENASPRGFDNLTVPLATVLVLNAVS